MFFCKKARFFLQKGNLFIFVKKEVIYLLIIVGGANK